MTSHDLQKKRLAIIPARGGSKRIKKKNIADFIGSPIISRPLSAIKNTDLFSEIHVSTDDQKIYDVVSNLGFRPLFFRSTSLADDHTPLKEVNRAVVKKYMELGVEFDTVVLVFSTAAFLESDVLFDAVKKFEAIGDNVQMISVSEYPVPIGWALSLDPDGLLVPDCKVSINMRSQDLPVHFYETADFVIYTKSSIFDDTSPRVGYLVPYDSIDIDTPEDWRQAEALARSKGSEEK